MPNGLYTGLYLFSCRSCELLLMARAAVRFIKLKYFSCIDPRAPIACFAVTQATLPGNYFRNQHNYQLIFYCLVASLWQYLESETETLPWWITE